MKRYFQPIIFLMAALIIFSSCEKDNYDAPTTSFSGRIVYNGNPIDVEYGQVRIQLWEQGWQLETPIDVAIAQDGSFSALLFDGTYKMIIPASEGPFMKLKDADTESDTILLNISGDKIMDIEVKPYYTVKNAQFSASGSDISTSVDLDKIITDEDAKDIERVSLYINRTQFVSGAANYNIAQSSVDGGDIADIDNIDLSLTVPQMVPAQDYVFARVGVKIAGVEDMLFSPVQKISLK